ncbi:phosphoglycerol transferase [Ereboglobus sp. PH5-10]|uniref:DUF7024 domain-containing protein n=1 Tax=Ereboglobus sp. PH5-10 TaxID=2940629 RepID=UPI002406E97F|nr:hypothetical protein [Ereboglobus sp. PH5-10]MDF9828229.1 phosphoglycerol transferase [Ereboglobus sp. PH5-10]
MTNNTTPASHATHYLGLAALLVVAYHLFLSSIGQGIPYVMADEWLYNESTRLLPIAEAKFPSYVYFILYKIIILFEKDFLAVVKYINIFIYVAALPFIHSICRLVASEKTSIGVATLALLLPFGSYTTYFMPESLYFLFFWILTWLLFYPEKLNLFARAAIIGVWVGCGMMVKFHACFLIPAICVFLLIKGFTSPGGALKSKLLPTLTFSGFTLMTRFALGYLIAGQNGLSLTGKFYGGLKMSPEMLQANIGNIGLSVSGNLIAVLLLYGLPIIVILYTVASRHPASDDRYQKLMLWGVFCMATLIPVTGLYTAIAAEQGPYEIATRLHLRYYNFAFPIFLILLAGAERRLPGVKRGAKLLIPSLLIVILPPISYKIIKKYFALGVVDCPELFSLMGQPGIFGILIVAATSIGALFFIKKKLAARITLWGYIPLLSAISMVFFFSYFKKEKVDTDYTIGGRFTKEFLQHDIDKLTIIGDAWSGLFAALFFTDSNKVVLMHKDDIGDPNDLFKRWPDRWFLIISNTIETPTQYQRVVCPSFILAHANDKIIVDFTRYDKGFAVESTAGLSGQEVFGRWSDSELVKIRFKHPLPKSFSLVLTAEAFGPNKDEEFVIRAGNTSHKFKLEQGRAKVGPLAFVCPIPWHDIEIIVPNPKSPAELNMGNDSRKLGIAISRLEILSLEQ